MLDVSLNFFYEQHKLGKVQYVKVGSRSQVLQAQLDAWLKTFEIVTGVSGQSRPAS